MSFFTTLHFYRPTKPPVLTTQSLAVFLRKFNDLGVAENHKYSVGISANLKFGERIDQDNKPSSWMEPLNSILSESREIEWDFTAFSESISEIVVGMEGQNRSVYRGYLGLGSITDEICTRIQRRDSPENEHDLTLDSWSMDIGPIESADLGSERAFTVGWISLELSGYGYLYPWTFRELVERAEQAPQVVQVMELCRRTWPVPPAKPSCRERVTRRRMRGVWPYPRIDLPWDWYWGIHETG